MLALALALLADPQVGKPVTELPPLVPDAQAVSPDHLRIAVSTRDDGVWVIELGSGRLLAHIPATSSPARCLAWSGSSQLLALLRDTGDLSVVAARDGVVSATFRSELGEPIYSSPRELRFAAHDSVVIAALGTEPTDLFSISPNARVAQIGSDSKRTTAIAVSPQGDLVALGDITGDVKLYTARYGLAVEARTSVACEARHPGVHALAFDPTGTRLAIGGGDCVVRIWDPHRPDDFLGSLSHCDADMFGGLAIGSVEFSRDGTRLLSMSYDFWDARVWDIASARVLDHFDYSGGNPFPMRAWFSVNDTRVVTALGCRVAVIDPGTPLSSQEMAGRLKPVPGGSPSGAERAWWQHDGDYAWAVVDHNLVVRKIPDEEPVLRIPVREK